MRTLAVLIVLLLFGGLAHGRQRSAEKIKAQAMEHFDAGKTAYRLRDYDTAISEWKNGYQIKTDPVFLFNIGQAYREKRDFENAIAFYTSYLKEDPSAKNRDLVEQRISEMKEAMEQQRKAAENPPSGPVKPDPNANETPTPPEPPPPSPASARGGGLKVGGAVLGVAGLVAVGVGVVLGVSAKSDESDINSALQGGPYTPDLADRENAARTKALAATLTIGVGAAAVVGGAILYIVGIKQGHAIQVVPEASAHGASLTVRASW
jgi:tetratricopeptide (TPR) repeat protein